MTSVLDKLIEAQLEKHFAMHVEEKIAGAVGRFFSDGMPSEKPLTVRPASGKLFPKEKIMASMSTHDIAMMLLRRIHNAGGKVLKSVLLNTHGRKETMNALRKGYAYLLQKCMATEQDGKVTAIWDIERSRGESIKAKQSAAHAEAHERCLPVTGKQIPQAVAKLANRKEYVKAMILYRLVTTSSSQRQTAGLFREINAYTEHIADKYKEDFGNAIHEMVTNDIIVPNTNGSETAYTLTNVMHSLWTGALNDRNPEDDND